MLGANVERLTLRGTNAVSATANALYGNAAANALYEIAGPTVSPAMTAMTGFDGGAGIDKVVRGSATTAIMSTAAATRRKARPRAPTMSVRR